MATNNRIIRMIKLGQAIANAPHGLTIERYAKKHGYSRSSLYRDIEVLRECEFPIESRSGKHYLPADFRFFGRGGFGPDELLALNAMRLLAGRLPGSLVDRALQSVWAKLGSGESTGAGAVGRAPSIAAFSTLDYAPYRQTIETIERASHEHIVLTLRYRRTNGEQTSRDFEPHAVHADAAVEGLYVVGYCRLRCAVRTLAIHRIHACRATGEVFAARAELRSAAQVRSAFRAWMSDNPPTAVKLRFSPAVAAEIAERRFHPSQESALQPDGSLAVGFLLAEPASLVRWLLGFGPDVQVDQPSDLAMTVHERHAQAAGMRIAQQMNA